MRYQKIKRVPFNGNSKQCLVLRHIYAKKMFDMLSDDYRLINIDESWLNQADFIEERRDKEGL